MYSLLVVLATLIAIFLIIIVLLQSSKGGGLAGTFGGANMGTVFGTRRTADFLSKATWWLAGILAALAIVINLFLLPAKMGTDNANNAIQNQRGGNTSQPVQR